jgi:hypothetical protein
MADEGLSPGSVSLEPGEAQEPLAPPVVAAAEAPPAAVDEDDAEVPPGQTMIPLAVLQATREKLKGLKATTAEKDTIIAALQAKADRGEAIEGNLRQIAPILQALRERPELMRQIERPAAEDPGPLSPAEAEDYARTLELYDAQGQPDVKRAQRAAKMQQRMANEATQRATQPLIQRNAQTEAASVRLAALTRNPDVDAKTFDEIWQHLPPELVVQNPQGISELAIRVARGSSPRQAAPPPVVHTETPGGRSVTSSSLNDLDRRMARETGKTQAEFAKTKARYNPNGPNVLEDA